LKEQVFRRRELLGEPKCFASASTTAATTLLGRGWNWSVGQG